MRYIELHCTLPLGDPEGILVAKLSALGYEGFVEHDSGFCAYIKEDEFDPEALVHMQQSQPVSFSYDTRIIEEQNWNREWESGYEPVVIDGVCCIRASFHPVNPDVQYDILIDPKMSFGTGHHETTAMMAGLLGGMSLSGCRVLDMGCGTGVLAILCAKMGAVEVTAIDHDEWAFTNCLENVERNTVHAVTAYLADASMLQEMQPETFDVVLANINLNVLVHDMEHYVRVLKTGGSLLLSGFYQADHERISAVCKQFSLLENRFLIQNDWMALLLRKQ